MKSAPKAALKLATPVVLAFTSFRQSVCSSIPLWSGLRSGRVPEVVLLKAKSRGVVLLDESLADLVRAQKVTVEVAKQFAEAPADFEALVARRK